MHTCHGSCSTINPVSQSSHTIYVFCPCKPVGSKQSSSKILLTLLFNWSTACTPSKKQAGSAYQKEATLMAGVVIPPQEAKLAYMMETIIPSSMLFTASCQMTTAATDRDFQSCGGAYQVFKQVIFHMWNLDEVNSICVISKHHPLLCLRLLVIL